MDKVREMSRDGLLRIFERFDKDGDGSIDEGEFVLVVGPSGSGKSTLLRAVNGLNPVVRGEVHVDAGDRMVSVTNASKDTLRQLRLARVAMVFQSSATDIDHSPAIQKRPSAFLNR